MVETILQVAEQNHVKTIYIEAQTHAIGFYEKFGFQVVSEPFEEAGIMHVEMKKRVGE
jgi:predicted GNAT family N-acyltransferase